MLIIEFSKDNMFRISDYVRVKEVAEFQLLFLKNKSI